MEVARNARGPTEVRKKVSSRVTGQNDSVLGLMPVVV